MTTSPLLGTSFAPPPYAFSGGAPAAAAPAPGLTALEAFVQQALRDRFGTGGAGYQAPTASAGCACANPALAAQTDLVRQQLSVLGLDGQRLAGGAPAFDPQQMQQMLTLLVGLIMLGAVRQPPGFGTGAFPGGLPSGGDLGGVPSSGRDLGRLGEVGALPTGAAPAGGGVSAAELQRIVPGLSAARAAEMAPHINQAMAEAGIESREQQAAFVAQLAHESGGFRYMEEIADGSAYEGRRDLGNTQPGDGRRFKGRGPIQLTGRANYRAAGEALGLDLVNNPELAARPDVGFRIAAWYWNSRGLNELAGAGNFREVTRRINGGYNGLADRQRYYQRALQVV